MRAWNAWYHISGHTYGSWLPGDPRGWRSRHHREHCDGDYKNPPAAGTHDNRLLRSKQLMARLPVRLSAAARQVACDLFVNTLLTHHLEPLAVSVDDHHYHVLARFTDHQPRRWIGIAKSRVSGVLSDAKLAPREGVWAVRCNVTPIEERRHQVRVLRYILRHRNEHTAVWSFRPDAARPAGASA